MADRSWRVLRVIFQPMLLSCPQNGAALSLACLRQAVASSRDGARRLQALDPIPIEAKLQEEGFSVEEVGGLGDLVE